LSSINLRPIDADADYTHTLRLELAKPLLKTPQLGVT
jgi:hypothetical protein